MNEPSSRLEPTHRINIKSVLVNFLQCRGIFFFLSETMTTKQSYSIFKEKKKVILRKLNFPQNEKEIRGRGEKAQRLGQC